MVTDLLFDLDGTLTDSGPGIMNCAQYALEHYGLAVEDTSRLRAFVGPPLRESFPLFGVPEAHIDEAIRIFRSRYVPIGKFENEPYPGIAALLARLKAEGYALHVATSKPETTAVEILEHYDLAQYFTKICGASLEEGRETKQAVLAYLLEQLEHPGQLLMIGDTAYDVQGAKVHGIPTLGVTWGYGSKESMEQAGAIAFAGSPEELYSLLKTL